MEHLGGNVILNIFEPPHFQNIAYIEYLKHFIFVFVCVFVFVFVFVFMYFLSWLYSGESKKSVEKSMSHLWTNGKVNSR